MTIREMVRISQLLNGVYQSWDYLERTTVQEGIVFLFILFLLIGKYLTQLFYSRTIVTKKQKTKAYWN